MYLLVKLHVEKLCQKVLKQILSRKLFWFLKYLILICLNWQPGDYANYPVIDFYVQHEFSSQYIYAAYVNMADDVVLVSPCVTCVSFRADKLF